MTGAHGHGLRTLEDVLHRIEDTRQETINESLKPNFKSLDETMAKYGMPIIGTHNQKDLHNAENNFYSSFFEGIYGASTMANKKEMARAFTEGLLSQVEPEGKDKLKKHILMGEKQEAIGYMSELFRASMTRGKKAEVANDLTHLDKELKESFYKKLTEVTTVPYAEIAGNPMAVINDYLRRTPPAHSHTNDNHGHRHAA